MTAGRPRSARKSHDYVSPYEGEKTRKEGTADSVRVRHTTIERPLELIDFHEDKTEPEGEIHGKSDQNPPLLVVVHCQHNQPIGYAAEQQEQGFTRQVRQVKQFLPRRPAGIVTTQDDKSMRRASQI